MVGKSGDHVNPAIAPLADAVLTDESRRVLIALAKGPLNLGNLAAAAGCPAEVLRPNLRHLALHELIQESGDQFGLTPLVEIEREEGRVQIRVSNKNGDFLQIRVKEDLAT